MSPLLRRPTIGGVSLESAAELLLLLPRAPRRGDPRREPGAAQRARPLAARGARQRAGGRRHGDVARPDQAVRLRPLRRAGGPGGLGPRRAPRAVHARTASWPPTRIVVVAIAVVGGLSSITGVILGSLFVVGFPAFFPDSPEVALLTSGAGVLILLLYFPGGFVQVLFNLRDLALAKVAARHPEPAPGERPRAVSSRPVAPLAQRPPVPEALACALDVEQVSVRFGHRIVVDDVDLTVAAGRGGRADRRQRRREVHVHERRRRLRPEHRGARGARARGAGDEPGPPGGAGPRPDVPGRRAVR